MVLKSFCLFLPLPAYEQCMLFLTEKELRLRHLGVLLGYLEQVLQNLEKGQIAAARKKVRNTAKIHWDRRNLGSEVVASRLFLGVKLLFPKGECCRKYGMIAEGLWYHSFEHSHLEMFSDKLRIFPRYMQLGFGVGKVVTFPVTCSFDGFRKATPKVFKLQSF